ncbi:MAG: hypothetical protein GX587_00955 [Bacteroidales bacterium]|nr:hypothetical protein [Bacteroidales bacterium]
MKQYQTSILKLIVIAVLFITQTMVQPLQGFGQPSNWFGDITTIGNTAFVNAAMADRNSVRATQPMQAQTTKTNAKFLYTTAPGVYTPKWVGSTNNYTRTVNQKLTFADGAYIYTSGGWDHDLEIPVIQGYYYTFIIGKYSDANNDISILETSFLPTSIQNVSQLPYIVEENQEVSITVNLSQTINEGEYPFVRYTTNNWNSSSFLQLNHISGTQYGATIPGFTNGTSVDYYILTSIQQNPSPTDIDYLSLRIDNNDGSNYAYTVGASIECGQQSGVVTSEPAFPLPDQALSIFFNAELGNGGLIN